MRDRVAGGGDDARAVQRVTRRGALNDSVACRPTWTFRIPGAPLAASSGGNAVPGSALRSLPIADRRSTTGVTEACHCG